MEKKILIVADDLNTRELFYDLLSIRGYKIITTFYGEDVPLITKNEKPDLILLDTNTQKLNALETLKQLKMLDAKAKVLLLAEAENLELNRLAHLGGASGVVIKTWGLLPISKIINAILEEKLESIEEGRKKILIADDDKEICLLTGNFLARRGFKPVIATTGEEALKKLRDEKPAIILLDINMPGMDGLVALKKIKEINASAAVFVITGLSDENIANKSIGLGASGYLVKPLNLDYLAFSLISRVILLSS